VWGNGFTVVNSILHHPWTWQALMSVLICKVLATASMVGSGAVGGVFTPTLFCGAVLGALVGTGVHALWPETATPSTAYAVVGMGAFLAATTHAPLMSIVMVFELTRQYEIVLPMMLASIAAHYMARSFGRGKSIYSDSLEGKPNQKPKGRPFQLLDLLRDPDRAVPGRTSADGVRRLFADTSYNRLQCVDEQSIWLGSISRAVADKAPAGSTAAALVEPDHRALTTGMSLEQALLVACDISSEILPVVDEAGKYLGNISKSDLLRVLQRQLHQKA
jgi:chloride channel protein, CIC family